MPASFWCPADFSKLTRGSPETLLETVRLRAQVYYYNLLIQPHLPYIMRIGDNTKHEYPKMTCFNASREILTRFIAHRNFNPLSSCSRPVDFFALLAAMTLLLAHLDAHHYQDATNILAHQRLSDRAMLEQALERMDVISHFHKDAITEQSAMLIRRLLEVEADAAEASSYTASSVKGDNDDSQEDRKQGEKLYLRVPYLGVIKITRQGPISREPWLVDAISCPSLGSPLTSQAQPTYVGRDLAAVPGGNALATIHPASITNGQNPDYILQSAIRDPTLYGGPGCEQSTVLQDSDTGCDKEPLQPLAGLPPITAGIDD